MNGSAHVQSFDAVSTVRTALLSFSDQIELSLSMIDVEMRRVLEWLEHDRPQYWRKQERLATDDVTAARAALHRCLMYPIADERPSCYEERAALKVAEARLAECRDKAEKLKHWVREVRHELFEYEGRIRQLVDVVEFDVPQAIGILAKVLARLEEYRAMRQGGVVGEATAAVDASLAEELWPKKPQPEEGPQE